MDQIDRWRPFVRFEDALAQSRQVGEVNSGCVKAPSRYDRLESCRLAHGRQLNERRGTMDSEDGEVGGHPSLALHDPER